MFLSHRALKFFVLHSVLQQGQPNRAPALTQKLRWVHGGRNGGRSGDLRGFPFEKNIFRFFFGGSGKKFV